MTKKTTGMTVAVLLLAGAVSAQFTNRIYSEANDGLVEFRDGWTVPSVHWENGTSIYGTIGDWFGTNGLVCTVLPFQIPSYGAVTNPFTSAELQVFLQRNELINNVDLYYLGTSSNAALVATRDYFSGTLDPSATLLEPGFITPSSATNGVLISGTSASSNLLSILNAAYDAGAGAGDYLFLRMSYSSDAWPTNVDSAAIYTRNAAGSNNWPTLLLESTVNLAIDDDGDGLPNAWELKYGLLPNDSTGDNGASGDPDGDGRDNATEFAQDTDPTKAVDGAVDPALYGSPVSVQTVNTAWGDNNNELNAAYAYVSNRRLYLMLTGNIEGNWNKLELFFDTTDAVQTNVLNTMDGDDGFKMDGMVFDAGFEPDYHLFFRRDNGAAYMDLIDLAAQTNSQYGSLFPSEGYAKTGTGPANSRFMELAYKNANTGGVIDGVTSAAANHWTNSIYGLELSIDLQDLGNPTGTVRIAAMINGSGRDFLSNQVLGELIGGTDALGGDMFGGWNGSLSNINFNATVGDQFFPFDVGIIPSGAFWISRIAPGAAQIELELSDLTVGATYRIQDRGQLGIGAFGDVAGSGFTATNTTQTITLPAASAVRFFQAVSP